jgi:hypothetical protein
LDNTFGGLAPLEGPDHQFEQDPTGATRNTPGGSSRSGTATDNGSDSARVIGQILDPEALDNCTCFRALSLLGPSEQPKLSTAGPRGTRKG